MHYLSLKLFLEAAIRSPCRMQDFYLAASEMTFRYGGNMVFQIKLKKNQDTLPLKRGYITDWERTHPLEGR